LKWSTAVKPWLRQGPGKLLLLLLLLLLLPPCCRPAAAAAAAAAAAGVVCTLASNRGNARRPEPIGPLPTRSLAFSSSSAS
jgi:hypothetical protein